MAVGSAAALRSWAKKGGDDLGYALAMGSCYGCHKMFTFNPVAVPSIKGEPICRDCMDMINAMRKERGNEPFPVRPDAYEPVDESEL